jgi:hypothetical protein
VTVAAGLLPQHLALITASGIKTELVEARGYRSVTNKAELRRLGFAASQLLVPTLLVPVWDVTGNIGTYQHRPDAPRLDARRKAIKYETPASTAMVVDVPPLARPWLGDPKRPLFITEGVRKADAAVSQGLCCIALLGVWNWRGTNGLGGKTALPDWEAIALEGRKVYIAFDSDVMHKPAVYQALARLKRFLEQRKADVWLIYMPPGEDGQKLGLDDFLAADDVKALLRHATRELLAPPTPPATNGNGSHGTNGSAVVPPKRMEINASEPDLPRITGHAWAAIKRANEPPHLFRYAGAICRIEHDDARAPLLRALNQDHVRYALARAATWVKIEVDRKTGAETPSQVLPPMHVVRDVLATPDPPLPVLVRIVEAPVFGPGGELQTTTGYHAASRTYYDPPKGFVVRPVPDRPSAEELGQARSYLLEELLGDFPFVDHADRAHALAALLQPFARDLIDGPTPGHMIEAPAPGSGKGLLADVITLPAVGRHVGTVTQARDDAEWRKRLTAQLVSGHPVILIDNITRPLDSGVLASALTTPAWEDRLLGTNEMANVPVRCLWLATANNPVFSTEMMRRFIRVRLDPRVDRPWERRPEEFRHANLREWAKEKRADLVWSALVLVRAWIAAGRPRYTERTLGSFDGWSAVIGGILSVAGVPGFLGNLSEFYEAADLEGTIWRAFVAAWWDKHRENEVGAGDLFPIALETDGFDLDARSERGQRVKFGKLLANKRDRVIGDYRVTHVGVLHKADRWRLLPVTGQLLPSSHTTAPIEQAATPTGGGDGDIGDIGGYQITQAHARTHTHAHTEQSTDRDISPHLPTSPRTIFERAAALAEALGHPPLSVTDWIRIGAGRASWEDWLVAAAEPELGEAVAQLQVMLDAEDAASVVDQGEGTV